MAAPRPAWQFSIPTLPKSVYTFVKEFGEDEEVSHWHTVLIALLVLARLPAEQRESVKAEILKKFPYPGARSCR